MKGRRLAYFMATMGLFVYPLNDLACISLITGGIIVSIFCAKDSESTVKALQPALMLAPIYVIRGLISLSITVIQNIGLMANDNYYSSKLSEGITDFNRVMPIIYAIIVLFYFVIMLMSLLAKTDVPLFGGWARKIVNASQEKKATKQNATQKTEPKNETNDTEVEPKKDASESTKEQPENNEN